MLSLLVFHHLNATFAQCAFLFVIKLELCGVFVAQHKIILCKSRCITRKSITVNAKRLCLRLQKKNLANTSALISEGHVSLQSVVFLLPHKQ